jgi:diacylglycerol kinase family enzyme
VTSYLLIVNPVAGKGVGAARGEQLRAALARTHPVEMIATTGRGDATELARSRGPGHDRVIAIGGDGTLNEVLTGLMEIGDSAATRPALGFLPGGTANVATEAFDFTIDPKRLAARLPDVRERAVDVGVVELSGVQRPFLLWCGAGLDAVVIETLNATRTGHMGIAGLIANAPRVWSSVARYESPRIDVEAEGVPPHAATSVLLANVRPLAFGRTIHPEADPFDGRLDLVSSMASGRRHAFGLGWHLMVSSLTRARGVAHHTTTAVHLTAAAPVPVQIDGEPVGTLPISVTLAPAAIRLLIPQRAPPG